MCKWINGTKLATEVERMLGGNANDRNNYMKVNMHNSTQAQANKYKPTNEALGLINGIVSGISFGLIPLFSIPVIAAGMGNVSILVYRFLFGSLAMLLMLLLRKTNLRITLSEFWRIAIL